MIKVLCVATKADMIRIPSTPEKAAWCKEYLAATGGLGCRGEFDGNELQQLMGLQAQITVTDWLGIPRPQPINGFDGGVDFEHKGKRYDVKCELRSSDFKPRIFVHNLCGNQLGYSVDRYVFVSYNRTTGIFEICGWIEKDDAVEYGTMHESGSKRQRSDGSFFTVTASGGLLEVDNYFLRPMEVMR